MAWWLFFCVCHALKTVTSRQSLTLTKPSIWSYWHCFFVTLQFTHAKVVKFRFQWHQLGFLAISCRQMLPPGLPQPLPGLSKSPYLKGSIYSEVFFLASHSGVSLSITTKSSCSYFKESLLQWFFFGRNKIPTLPCTKRHCEVKIRSIFCKDYVSPSFLIPIVQLGSFCLLGRGPGS